MLLSMNVTNYWMQSNIQNWTTRKASDELKWWENTDSPPRKPAKCATYAIFVSAPEK